MKKKKRLVTLLLTAVMAASFTACGGGSSSSSSGSSSEKADSTSSKGKDTLVVAYDFFNQKFSPFFAKTSYDTEAQAMTQVALMNIDREGSPVLKGIEGEKRSYNGKEYTYKGISDIEVVQNSDGTVDYNITLRKDIKFSDGEPLTIDDVIFNMYVLADPTYDGSSSFYTLPIEGLEEYRSSMVALSDLILKATPENTDFSKWTKEQQDKYWAAFNAAGEKFVQEIIDYCKSNGLDPKNYYNNDVAMGMAEWGFGEINDKGVLTAPSGATFDLAAGKFPTAADYWKEIVKKYGYDV